MKSYYINYFCFLYYTNNRLNIEKYENVFDLFPWHEFYLYGNRFATQFNKETIEVILQNTNFK